MQITIFIKGLIIGFSIAAPVGPIGILCIKRTLSSGRVIGLLSGLGAATADSLYGAIAAFGLTSISNFFLHQHTLLRLIGGSFLCYLGLKTIFTAPLNPSSQENRTSKLNAYTSTFALTLSNPLTILSFAAVFAGFGLVSNPHSYPSAGITVFGVFCGSAFWWLILSGFTSLFSRHLNTSRLLWVNRISGSIILAFGVLAILGSFS